MAVEPSFSGSQEQDKSAVTRQRRAHNACLPCRTRKCKCDLGDVDAPSEPPCGKCRREGRECVFVETRRGQRRSSTAGRSVRQTTELNDAPPAPQQLRMQPSSSDQLLGSSPMAANRLAQTLGNTPIHASDTVRRDYGGAMVEPHADITFDFFSEPVLANDVPERHEDRRTVAVVGSGSSHLAVPEDMPDGTFKLVEQGILDWDHLGILVNEYFERTHVWLVSAV